MHHLRYFYHFGFFLEDSKRKVYFQHIDRSYYLVTYSVYKLRFAYEHAIIIKFQLHEYELCRTNASSSHEKHIEIVEHSSPQAIH